MLVSFIVLLFTAMPGEKQVTTLKKLDHKSLTSRKKKCASSLYLVSLYLVTISFSTTKMYKQVNGCTRGSPIRHVVTNLCMEKAKESAITASLSFQIWKQYIADSFCPGGKMQLHPSITIHTTILVHSLDNITFFSFRIHNHFLHSILFSHIFFT